MEFFCQHLVHAAAATSEAAHPPFERFLMRGMLFLNATLRSTTFCGTVPVHFRINEAAQQQVFVLPSALCYVPRLRGEPNVCHKFAVLCGAALLMSKA
jgi:hypothetical protein